MIFFNGSEKSSLMHKKILGKQKPLLEKVKDVLGRKLYDELSEIKEEIKLGAYLDFLISVF